MHIDAIIRLIRPGDWVKNLFVVPAFFFALPMVHREAIASGDAAPWVELVVLTIYVCELAAKMEWNEFAIYILHTPSRSGCRPS
jgi:hypothetical protein